MKHKKFIVLKTDLNHNIVNDIENIEFYVFSSFKLPDTDSSVQDFLNYLCNASTKNGSIFNINKDDPMLNDWSSTDLDAFMHRAVIDNYDIKIDDKSCSVNRIH